jgi:hypothetical protein
MKTTLHQTDGKLIIVVNLTMQAIYIYSLDT